MPLVRQGFTCTGLSRRGDGTRVWLCLRSLGAISSYVQIWASDTRAAFVESGVFAMGADLESAAAELFGSLAALTSADSDAKIAGRRVLASSGSFTVGGHRLTFSARPYARSLRIELA